MKSKRTKLPIEIKSTLVYTVASLFSKGLSIVTAPIFTRLMTSSEIGVVTIYNSWHSMIAVIASLALTSGGFQLAMKEFKGERCRYISSILSLTSGIALLIGGAYCIAPSFFENLLGMSRPLMILLIAHLLFSPAYDCWLMWQKYEYKYIASGLVSVLSALFAVSCSVLAVFVAASAGISQLGEIRLIANYMVLLTVAFVFWLYFFIKGKTFYSARYWKFSLALSVPLIGNSFAAQILNVSDRVMISRIVDNSAVGIYGTLYTASSAFLIVWNAINTSFIPFLFNNIERPEKGEKVKTTASLLLATVSLAAFLITLVAPEIVKLLAPEEYYEAIYIMPPITAGVFLTAVANMYSNILIYHKETRYVMVSTIIAAAANLALNYYGIHFFGYMAAAYTTLIAYMIHALIQAMISVRVRRCVKGENADSVYSTKSIFEISVVTILSCLSCAFLYQTLFIRYIIFIAVVILVIEKKDVLLSQLLIKEA